jgi:deoxyribodipyrimidine photo-lyase
MWFRQDLRLRDNPALTEAALRGAVLPLYILDDINAGEWAAGGASRWWLQQSLSALNGALDGGLQLFRGDPLVVLPHLLSQQGITRIVWNRCYEPWQIKRDKALRQQLQELGIEVLSFNAGLLWEPWEVLKKDGTPYQVFTPYYRRGCLGRPQPRLPLPAPQSVDCAPPAAGSVPLAELGLMPSIHWYGQIEQEWQPGEEGAADRLSVFLRGPVQNYSEDRNRPAQSGTSRLSPHMHFGEISPHQVWHAARGSELGAKSESDLDCFLSELGWREFSHYLLFHHPQLPTENFKSRFDAFDWQGKDSDLRAWQQGSTGIPIVDAGMRELWQTGFMHNRVRMIVGSFLVKNLLVHWREGARWFHDCLLDADLAANSCGWQWVAGSGADAAPYFRIFNPVTQGKKFDGDGRYVRRFCPELSGLPDRYLHNPWEAPPEVLQAAGVALGDSYPAPLVDLKFSRERALAAFARLREQSSTKP